MRAARFKQQAAGLGLAVVLGLAACMPASWGAGALLHPSRRPLSAARPAGAREVEFDGEGGVRLKGWLTRGSGPRRGTLVYLHGSADNRASGLYAAERFLARGFDALAYDGRAHGESGGDACTYGFFEKRDLARALDLLPASRWGCWACRSAPPWPCRPRPRTRASRP